MGTGDRSCGAVETRAWPGLVVVGPGPPTEEHVASYRGVVGAHREGGRVTPRAREMETVCSEKRLWSYETH